MAPCQELRTEGLIRESHSGGKIDIEDETITERFLNEETSNPKSSQARRVNGAQTESTENCLEGNAALLIADALGKKRRGNVFAGLAAAGRQGVDESTNGGYARNFKHERNFSLDGKLRA